MQNEPRAFIQPQMGTNGKKLLRLQSSHLPVFPRLIREHLVEEGFSDREIFADLEFTEHDLRSENFRLSAEEHEQFIKRAVDLTSDPHLALAMNYRAIDVRANAVLMLFAASGRVSKGLRLIAHFNHLFTRTLTVRLAEQYEAPVFDVECHVYDERVAYFALSSFALFVDRFFCEALQDQHLVKQAEFALPQPPSFDAARDRFGFVVRFDCERTRLRLDPSLIDKPLRYADPQTTRLITEVCERQLVELNAETGIVGAVRALIVEHISAPPSQSEAAYAMGVSQRSLRRSLQAAETSYMAILTEARRELAMNLLLNTDEPVSGVGYQIGYENPSHFGRAFKSWTGQSPTEFREAGR